MSRPLTASALATAAAFLAVGAAAQTMGHPCDDRTQWPAAGKHDGKPVSSPEGLYYAAAFDYLTLQSDKVKSIPAVERFFNQFDVSPDRRDARDKTDRANRECVGAPDQNFFVQCDAVLNRAYLSVAGIALSDGRWVVPPEKPGRKTEEAALKQARAALTLACDQYDSRRQAYARRLRRDADMTASARLTDRRRAQAAQAAPAPKPAPAPAVEEASMISLPLLAPHVDPEDPRLQSNQCRHLCEAYQAFGNEGCYAGMDAAMKRWCDEKYAAVQAERCVCR